MERKVYVGMDVHKGNYTLCSYSMDEDELKYKQTISSDYKMILKYLEQIRTRYTEDIEFVCGYETGCLGYSLYHQLTEARICAIACSDPPEDHARWTLQMIADELIRLEVLDYITDSAVCETLKKTS